MGTPSTLLGDRSKLRLVVGNIVSNAVKHTAQGKITVEWGEMADDTAVVEVQEELNQQRVLICISVADTGCVCSLLAAAVLASLTGIDRAGIPAQTLDNLFREFEQVESSTTDAEHEQQRARGGLGLGLAVVARIIRNLGGVLKCDSVVDQGTRFSVMLPFRLPVNDTASSTSGTAMQSVDPSLASSLSGGSRSAGSFTTTPGRQPQSPPGSMVRRNSNGSVRSGSLGSGGSLGGLSGGKASNANSQRSDIDSLVEAMATSPAMGSSSQMPNIVGDHVTSSSPRRRRSTGRPTLYSGAEGSHRAVAGPPRDLASSTGPARSASPTEQRAGSVSVQDATTPLRAVRMDGGSTQAPVTPSLSTLSASEQGPPGAYPFLTPPQSPAPQAEPTGLGLTAIPPASAPTWAPIASTSSSATARQRQLSMDSNASGGSGASLRVLVVEDDPINRAIIQRRLSKDGHKITNAEHGEIALKTFESSQRAFDVVLMDLRCVCPSLL